MFVDKQYLVLILEQNYGVSVIDIEKLELGADPDSEVYKVETNQGSLFLKAKKNLEYLEFVDIIVWLKSVGFTQIVAPIRTKEGKYFFKQNETFYVLYNYIDGAVVANDGMTEGNWEELAGFLYKLHNFQVSVEIEKKIKKENFLPRWVPAILEMKKLLDSAKSDSEFNVVWRLNQDKIENVVKVLSALSNKLTKGKHKLVLCHTDIHTHNVLLSRDGQISIIDWDNVMLAPKERDLMFYVDKKYENDFFSGYQDKSLNREIIKYYKFEWVAQEIVEYGEVILGSADDKRVKSATDEFRKLFELGDVYDEAISFAI